MINNFINSLPGNEESGVGEVAPEGEVVEQGGGPLSDEECAKILSGRCCNKRCLQKISIQELLDHRKRFSEYSNAELNYNILQKLKRVVRPNLPFKAFPLDRKIFPYKNYECCFIGYCKVFGINKKRLDRLGKLAKEEYEKDPEACIEAARQEALLLGMGMDADPEPERPLVPKKKGRKSASMLAAEAELAAEAAAAAERPALPRKPHQRGGVTGAAKPAAIPINAASSVLDATGAVGTGGKKKAGSAAAATAMTSSII